MPARNCEGTRSTRKFFRREVSTFAAPDIRSILLPIAQASHVVVPCAISGYDFVQDVPNPDLYGFVASDRSASRTRIGL